MTKVIYQLSLEPSVIQEVKNELKMPEKSDSQIVTEALCKFLDYETNVKLTVYAMKRQLEQNKTLISSLEDRNKALSDEIAKVNQYRMQLEAENQQLKNKVEELLNGVSTKIKSRKSKKKSK